MPPRPPRKPPLGKRLPTRAAPAPRRATTPLRSRPLAPPTKLATPLPSAPPLAPAPPTPLAPAPEPLLAPTHPEIRRLTAQLLELERRVATDDSRTRVEQGALLETTKERLDHGDWLAWIHTELPFTPRTAQRYIELSRWSRANPALFAQLTPLGSTKLYLLIALPPAKLEQLLRTQPHLIPDTTRRRMLDRMTVGELLLVLLAATAPKQTDPTTAKALSAYRRRIRGLLEATDDLLGYRATLAKEDVVGLHEDLVAAAKKLARAFRIPS